MVTETFVADNLATLQELIDDYIDELLAAGTLTWSLQFSRTLFEHEGAMLHGWQCVLESET